ncbi:cyclic-phosphate processing receiver domain-containing protein [Plantactinospora sp. CA-294935]|uniref:cyclic-phosphate processing receiver domain-containing protein n=1 Tax=Plantactinospora sp. CA-294935 TaxID=3240012 RepID=UPI003D9155BD
MTARKPAIVLIDDLRSFVDGRPAEVARTSSGGVDLLDRHRSHRLDELWLDHDLGNDDTIWPVVEVLERAAFEGQSFGVGVVIIHSANPAGAAKMAQALRRWNYPVRVAAGDPSVGYLDGIGSAG